MKRQKKIDKLEDNNLVLTTKIDAARKSGKIGNDQAKEKQKSNKRQIRKMKQKMREEEKMPMMKSKNYKI